MKNVSWLGLVSLVVLILPQWALAQPSRQMPGTRPYLPGTPPINAAALNPRTQAAASNTGVQSTDFYGKRGYPKVLGDSVETQSSGASASAAGVAGGSLGAAGGSLGSSGGALGAGGGLGGGGLGGGGLGGGIIGGGFNANNLGSGSGITGGGFSGLVPKGFGFGGVPVFEDSTFPWTRK
jgi:hypothetical protein